MTKKIYEQMDSISMYILLLYMFDLDTINPY